MLERLTDIDNAILHAIHDAFQSPAMDTAMTFVTSLGDMAFVWFVVAGLLLCKKEYRFYGGIVIIAIMCAYLVGELGLKNIIGRDRPFLADPHARDAAYRVAGKLLVPIGTHGQFVRRRHGALLSAHAPRLVQGNSPRRSRMRRILAALSGGSLSNRRISRHGARHRKRYCRRVHRPLFRTPQKEGQPPEGDTF